MSIKTSLIKKFKLPTYYIIILSHLLKLFFQNQKFILNELKIIKADLKSNIPSTKTLAHVHAFDPGIKYIMKNLHNQQAKIRKIKLVSLTTLQNLLKNLESLK